MIMRLRLFFQPSIGVRRLIQVFKTHYPSFFINLFTAFSLFFIPPTLTYFFHTRSGLSETLMSWWFFQGGISILFLSWTFLKFIYDLDRQDYRHDLSLGSPPPLNTPSIEFPSSLKTIFFLFSGTFCILQMYLGSTYQESSLLAYLIAFLNFFLFSFSVLSIFVLGHSLLSQSISTWNAQIDSDEKTTRLELDYLSDALSRNPQSAKAPESSTQSIRRL